MAISPGRWSFFLCKERQPHGILERCLKDRRKEKGQGDGEREWEEERTDGDSKEEGSEISTASLEDGPCWPFRPPHI